ncbi:TonB-dependent receptor, partial [Bacteroides heparinolyticus]|uniref:TonB-dependent receptor n=1 Tax=Prevotella heparinolytica TaxID=28113 RepID=UPI00359F5398
MKQKVLYLFLLLMLMSLSVSAQTGGGRIAGIVIDDSGEEPLPGATIFIEELKKGVAANGHGEFSFSDIPPATYTLTVKFMGYHAQTSKITVGKERGKKIIIRMKAQSQSLEEVIVMGKSEARKIREQAMPISVISMSQIQGTVNNVQDVLAKTAGITVRTMGGVGSASRISVRGLEGKRIGLFIDGHPMNDNSDFIDINDIPVEMIDRIEIYKGVVPAKFGGSAVGGAVNIVVKEYPPKYLDVNYSYGSFNTHKASVVSKMNIAPKGIEFGLGGFYNHSDNNYKMKSPFQEGLTITRDHDKFKKTVIGGSFKARKWWFDLVEFEPVFIHTYKDIQGIESNIQYAHSHSNAFIFGNKMEKDNFLLEGLDLDWQLGYIYTNYNFADTASHRTHWDGTHYATGCIFGGENGKWGSLLTNDKHQLQHKLNLNYLVNENHSVNFNSLLKYARANPRDVIKDKVIGYRTEFPSNMLSWVAGLNYDYRSSDDKFLNSVNIKYYHYSMKTRMASILTNSAEDIDTRKNDFGISNALRYRITPTLMAKASLGYDVRLPSEEELLGDGYVIAPAGNLIPEHNTSVNVGMMFDLTGKSPSNMQVEVNGFYMYLQDMIRFTGGFLQSQYQNFGEMRTLGVEAEVKADV